MKFKQLFLSLLKFLNEDLFLEEPRVKPVIKNKQTMQKTTKHNLVKKHLLEKGTIDSWTAINLYGATRLSAIIFNLRKEGYTILSLPKTSYDRNKNICNYTTYKINY